MRLAVLVFLGLALCFGFPTTALSADADSLDVTPESRNPENPPPHPSVAVMVSQPTVDSLRSRQASGIPADTAAFASPMVPIPSRAVDTAIPLLPDRISPIEKLLWGENGWVRSLASDPLNMEDREKEMRLRRAMLTTHQIMGFCTLGTLITTLVYGQMVLDGHGELRNSHFTWADISIASYSVTALLAITSPPPLVRRKEWNTVSWHKALACVHFTGMVLTPIIGTIIKSQIRQGENPVGLERFHQVSGYVTTAALATAMMVVTF